MSDTQPLPELEALLQPRPVEPLTTWDLDDLLKESKAQVAEAKAAKAAKDRLKRGGTYAEKEEDLRRIREWEAKHEWDGRANVGLFIQHQCACGTVLNVFEGLFRRDEHKHMKGAMRWVRVTEALKDLDNETVLQVKHTPVCQDCAELKGWDLDPDRAIVWDEHGNEVQHVGAADIQGDDDDEDADNAQEHVARPADLSDDPPADTGTDGVAVGTDGGGLAAL